MEYSRQPTPAWRSVLLACALFGAGFMMTSPAAPRPIYFAGAVAAVGGLLVLLFAIVSTVRAARRLQTSDDFPPRAG